VASLPFYVFVANASRLANRKLMHLAVKICQTLLTNNKQGKIEKIQAIKIIKLPGFHIFDTGK
jgi:hypothetical protein